MDSRAGDAAGWESDLDLEMRGAPVRRNERHRTRLVPARPSPVVAGAPIVGAGATAPVCRRRERTAIGRSRVQQRRWRILPRRRVGVLMGRHVARSRTSGRHEARPVRRRHPRGRRPPGQEAQGRKRADDEGSAGSHERMDPHGLRLWRDGRSPSNRGAKPAQRRRAKTRTKTHSAENRSQRGRHSCRSRSPSGTKLSGFSVPAGIGSPPLPAGRGHLESRRGTFL